MTGFKLREGFEIYLGMQTNSMEKRVTHVSPIVHPPSSDPRVTHLQMA